MWPVCTEKERDEIIYRLGELWETPTGSSTHGEFLGSISRLEQAASRRGDSHR